MKRQALKFSFAFFAITIATIAGYWWFFNSPYWELFFNWSQENLTLFFATLLVIKISGTIYPPIPGGLITMGAIPFLGWIPAYTADFLGSMLGSSGAYILGKRYGKRFLLKLFDKSTMERITRMRVKTGKEVESVFVLRILTGGTLIEAVCYGAGLLHIPYFKFLIGSALSHLTIGVPHFYLARSIFESKNVVISIVGIIASIIVLYKIKGRYFE